MGICVKNVLSRTGICVEYSFQRMGICVKDAVYLYEQRDRAIKNRKQEYLSLHVQLFWNFSG